MRVAKLKSLISYIIDVNNIMGNRKSKHKEVTIPVQEEYISPAFYPEAVDNSIPYLQVPNPAPAGPIPEPSAPEIEIDPFDIPEGLEKEPMLLLDTTGSMNTPTSEKDTTPRCDTIREAISVIVEKLAVEDSQAAHEEDGGGLRTITFANRQAIDLEDLNPNNLERKWSEIVWSGCTYIMPGWDKLKEVYMDEFGERAEQDQPALLALVITDGEAADVQEFAHALKHDHKSYVVIAIMGYGTEHDRALQSFNQVAERNHRVKVITLSAATNPSSIARTLLRMIE
jgi:hypothetical protein